MAREPQYKILTEMLRKAPGNALTLREIHLEGYIQNVADAAMQARRHGINITTEYLHDNPKIASYVLHEEASKPLTERSIREGIKQIENKVPTIYDSPVDPTLNPRLFPAPTNQRHYE